MQIASYILKFCIAMRVMMANLSPFQNSLGSQFRNL